jgi:uncharacterized membrane protein YphA (DoxX/SURF4 family)
MSRWAATGLRVLLGAVFIYAAYTKLSQSYLLFAMSIDAYGLLPEWGVLAVARGLPWLELLLGVWLLSAWRLRWAAVSAVAMLGVFFVLMIVSYARGMSIDCGCFGAGEALTWKTLVRDGALLAASVVLWRLAGRNPRGVTP